ncbi:MAG TPA: hypothetical protein VHV54_21910, partial [Candidatus Binatia bacterium]|nr:hypothetical protein [Candidatus Binatia bacterium]
MNSIRTILFLATILFATESSTQDAKLIDAAKKEGGKVTIYGSLETPVVEGVIQAFRKKTGLNA